jgi:anhydro-N-acetylmuramic acid kinase
LTELTPSYAKSAIAEDGHPTRPEFVSALTVDWPKELQPMIMKAFENELSLFDMTRVNYAAGAVYAEATNALLAQAGLTPEDIDVVATTDRRFIKSPLTVN